MAVQDPARTTGINSNVAAIRRSPWRHRYQTGATFDIRGKLFGGWRKANKVWFDLDNGRMVAIERAVGGPTH